MPRKITVNEIDVRKKTKVVPLNVCDPLDDRCVRPVEPSFMPGISVRHSPSCNGNICHLFACDGGNWRVTREGTLDRAEWIKGWAITQLFTRGFVDCEEHPLGKRDGGWWADVFRSDSGVPFRSGSKLWALQFVHGGAVNDTLLAAKDYARVALSYLQQWGIASRVDVDAFYIAKGPLQGRRDRLQPMGAVIQLDIHIVGPGLTSDFSIEGVRQPSGDYLWREYMPPSALAHPSGHHYVEAEVNWPRPR